MNRSPLLAVSAALLWLAVLAAAPAGASEVPFASLALVSPLADAYSPRAADIDRDGDLDVVGYADSTVHWFERGAAGNWVEHQIDALDSSRHVFALEIADLDRDGDTDVVIIWQDEVVLTEGADFAVAWYENDGTPAVGEWQRRTIRLWDGGQLYSNGGNGLAVADFDGDGDPDVAVTRWELSTVPLAQDFDAIVTWLASDGTPADGGWSAHQVGALDDFGPFFWYVQLGAADVEGDGDCDLIAFLAGGSTYLDTLFWFENDGTPDAGDWSRHSIITFADEDDNGAPLASGDLDRDGAVDLVAVHGASAVNWYRNDGTPAVGAWPTYDVAFSHPVALRLGDLDHDGTPDVALAGDAVSWADNDGTPVGGAWTERVVDANAVTGIEPADLDGDGDVDLAVADDDDFRFAWYENLEIHRSARLLDERGVNNLVDGAFDLAAGDLDGDGDADLVSAAEANDHVYWHRNDGTPGDDTTWSLSTLTSATDGPRAVALGDLDGDGDLDVVVGSYNDDGVSWLENDGTLANWTRRVISSGAGGASDVALADFDRDGDLDVACAQFLDGEISWYRNSGATPPAFAALFVDGSAYAGPRALAAGDLDGDGDADLAVVSETGDAIVWYTNDGTPADGQWSRHRTDNGDAGGPKEVALADLDRDGDLDTLVASYAGDAVAWYENDGTLAGWTRRALSVNCGGARGVATGDFDADGDPDVLYSCYDDGALWLARNNGALLPGFSSDLVSVTAGGVRTVVGTDLDRDGDLDGAAAQGIDDQIAWYENRGGQFRVSGTAIAADPLVNDAVQGVLRAVVTHRGRSGDGQIELATVAVRLEEAPGDPLDPWQAASLIDQVRLYGDDGDNVFEPGVDPLLAAVSPAGIDLDGVVRVNLADGAAAAALAATAQKTFFVALDLADPFEFAAPRTLVVTLLTNGADVCEAEDRTFDLPLDLEWRPNASTATLAVLDVLFRDGFETGDASRWSDSAP